MRRKEQGAAVCGHNDSGNGVGSQQQVMVAKVEAGQGRTSNQPKSGSNGNRNGAGDGGDGGSRSSGSGNGDGGNDGGNAAAMAAVTAAPT